MLKSLKRTTRKGKTKRKWTGIIAELKNFVALVLEHKGLWKIRRENNKQMYLFEKSDCNYFLTWWPSTLVMLFQGNPDVYDVTTAHLDKIFPIVMIIHFLNTNPYKMSNFERFVTCRFWGEMYPCIDKNSVENV